MPEVKKVGNIIILSSPSGAGKTTLVKKISKNKNFFTSISHTTRAPRLNEKHGKDYIFINKREFKSLIKEKKFLEQNVVFDIDWQGTRQIKNKKLKFKLILIYILPPSKKELYLRLLKRENNNKKTINKRMKQFKKDVLHWKDYDYVVVNDKLEKCYKTIMRFINSNKLQEKLINFNKKIINQHVKKLLK